jgi:hypothetical protein
VGRSLRSPASMRIATSAVATPRAFRASAMARSDVALAHADGRTEEAKALRERYGVTRSDDPKPS